MRQKTSLTFSELFDYLNSIKKAYAGFFMDMMNKEVYWIQVSGANESSYNMLSDMTAKLFQRIFLKFWKDIFLFNQTHSVGQFRNLTKIVHCENLSPTS